MAQARLILVLSGLLILSACSGADVEQAATSFHSGYADSTKAISNRTSALASVERTTSTFNLYAEQNAAIGDSSLVGDFASYVCFPEPSGLDKIDAGLATLGIANTVVDPANITPDKSLPAKIKGIFNATKDFPPLKPANSPLSDNVTFCKSVVSAYLTLKPGDLPSLERPSKESTAAVLVALPALISVVEAVWKATDTAAGFVEEEARADKLKRYVKAQDTQKTVWTAFSQIYTIDTAANNFCTQDAHANLCTPSVVTPPKPPKNGADGTAATSSASSDAAATTGSDSTNETPPAGSGKADASKPACFAQIDQQLYQVPEYRTIMDSVTIVERWSNLRLAWYSYYSLRRAPPSVDKVQRRQQLDQAISDYFAVPATGDIAGAMVQAWAKLTYLANDCLTSAQVLGELEVFAQNANSVLNSAKSISDAKDKFDSAIGPAKATK